MESDIATIAVPLPRMQNDVVPLSMAAACEGVAFSMPVRFTRLKGAVPMAYIPFSLEEGPTK